MINSELIRISLKQDLNKISYLRNIAEQVSDPKSAQYGKYWSLDDINNFIYINKTSLIRDLKHMGIKIYIYRI